MGLDSLAIVLAAESRFGIEIPDEAARKMLRIGDLWTYIVVLTGATSEEIETIWAQVVLIVSDEIGIEPEKVKRESRFVEELGVA